MGGEAPWAATRRDEDVDEEAGMQTVRCYLPLGPDQLAELRRERSLTGPLTATAVTDAVRATTQDLEEEEAEHAVAQVAAERLAADGAPVVLVAADLEGADVTPGDGPWVQVSGLTLPRVAALYLGDDVVTGDPGALPRPDEDLELELSWFDTTELDLVLDLAIAASGQPTHDHRGPTDKDS